MTEGQFPQQRYPEPAPARAGAGFFSRAAWLAATAAGVLLVGAAPAPRDVEFKGPGLPATAPDSRTSRADYRDGPPPGFSGGFGETSCHGCHSEMELNDPKGKATIEGVPERYTEGQVYPLTITLTRPGVMVAGFELTARFEQGGAQAGTLAVPSDQQGRLTVVTDRDVQYAYQRQAGSQLVAPDTGRWTVLWTAPAQGGPVQFNVAANAANQDDSTLGDYIYTTVAKADPQQR